ncbi:cell wall hydrolase [Curvivirga sp.]|uniref:cell wall hydrolase n=1 Tax=Curvivirga sp. TaxID=2856848 RepID=UPI003B59B1D0
MLCKSVKSKPLKILNNEEVDVLARTIWGEARGEQLSGMEAVASCVMNRVAKSQARGGHWWGNNVVDVCKKPYQFSCWNKDDPNLTKMLEVNEEDKVFASAKRIAKRALRGSLADSTNGATHYHAAQILPWWAKGRTPIAGIGRHKFYKNIG